MVLECDRVETGASRQNDQSQSGIWNLNIHVDVHKMIGSEQMDRLAPDISSYRLQYSILVIR